MDRRDFIKSTATTAAGAAAIAVTGSVATACKNRNAKNRGPRSNNGTASGDGSDGESANNSASANGGNANGGNSANVGKSAMTYRTNPKNGDQVSILGYGCMRWQMKKDADGKDIIDQESVNQLTDYALAHGVNYFDSSPVYLEGQSEKATGIALSRHPRESYKIATKLSNFSNWTRENSMLMYRKSFENFQTDYIDYYLLHSIGRSMEDFQKRYIDNGMLDFLMEEREKGHIRNLGFSFHGNRERFDKIIATHDKYHWDFVQIQMNWMDWTHASSWSCNAEYMYNELEKRGIPVVIMEPLLGGRLTRVPDHVAKRLKEREPEKSVASWAFRFAGTYPGVMCVLSGMTYMEHLQDNLKSYSPLVPLTADDLTYLEETADIMSRYPTIPCNDCKYCMPCPYGIDIPAILLHYNKCVNEGLVVPEPEKPGINSEDESSRGAVEKEVNITDRKTTGKGETDAMKQYSADMKAYKKARRAYLVSYDRSLEKIRQADHCIACGHCVSHCPQQIAIPRELRKIDSIVETLRRFRP